MVSAFFLVSLYAQHVLIQPSSYGTSFEGQALRFECVAALKRGGERGLVEIFRAKSGRERRVCLDQLQQSFTPEPDFTPEDFHRALKPNAQGSYELVSHPTIGNRLGVNIYAARGIAALADNHLIDDSSALGPLTECLNHPLLEVGKYCNRALTSLTRHRYGNHFFERSAGAPALTVENHQAVVADWRELNRLLAGGHPIFDQFIASECQAAIRAVAARLIPAVPISPGPASYLKGLADRAVIGFGTDEEVMRFDVGAHIVANWSENEAVVRIGLLMFRPGLTRPRTSETLNRLVVGFQNPDYRETFGPLDLELRFVIGTSDPVVRRSSVQAVKAALNGLRVVSSKARR